MTDDTEALQQPAAAEIEAPVAAATEAKAQPDKNESVSETGASAPKRAYSKTPFFAASNASRYQRQTLIKGIEAETGRTLLCYVGGNEAEIHRNDTAGFVDLLHNVRSDEMVDLMLHTIGGDIDIAEKLIKLVQARVGAANIRAIVPDFAKSAGTLMVFGAKSVLMSDTSELGTIDPQFVLKDELGNEVCHSVLNYLAAYRLHERALQSNPNDPVARIMLAKFDPAIVQKFQIISERARQIAESLLKRGGLPESKIASHFLDLSIYKSHNQTIGALDAREAGLDVELLEQTDPLWEKIWQLHCLQRMSITARQTLFESDYVNLPVDCP